MIPPLKSRVKILLRNNTITEGIVQEWSDTVKLQSLDDKSYMIILHPKEDIILIKVYLNNSLKEEISSNSEESQNELEQKFQQTLEQPSDDPNRIQSLAELRILLDKENRQMIVNKLKSHHIGETKKVEYGHPRFFSKPSPQ
jgi:sRNA-binding regulator protein Hfq